MYLGVVGAGVGEPFHGPTGGFPVLQGQGLSSLFGEMRDQELVQGQGAWAARDVGGEGGILAGYYLNGIKHQCLQKPDCAIIVRYIVKAVPVRLLFQCTIGICTEEGRHVTGAYPVL